MGAEHSKSDREKFSREEVERMLEHQRQLLEQQQLDQALRESVRERTAQQARESVREKAARQQQIDQAVRESVREKVAQQQQRDQAYKEFVREKVAQQQRRDQAYKEFVREKVAQQQQRDQAYKEFVREKVAQQQQRDQAYRECVREKVAQQQQINQAIRESVREKVAQQQQIDQAYRECVREKVAQQQQRDQAYRESVREKAAQQQQIDQAVREIVREKAAQQASFERQQIGVNNQPTQTSLYPNLGATAPAAPPPYHVATATHCYTGSSNSPVNNNPFNNLQTTAHHTLPMPTAPQAPPSPRPAPPASIPRQRFRERSRPRSQNRTESNDDELNCTTCNQKFTINIFQCNSGHSSCSNCKERCVACGICGYPISNVRNRSLEEYIAERKVSCPNAQDGCTLFFKVAEMEAHEKECPFKEMTCPLAATFGQCRWRGKLPQVSKHFEEAHPIHCLGEVNKEFTVTQTQQQIVYLVIIGTFNFLFNLKVSEIDRKIYLAVQLIGTKHSAEKWSYEVHVYNKNQPRRKYQYTDVCHSNSTPLNEIFNTEQCATLPFAYVDTFLNRNSLTYKFFIKKDVDNKPRNEGQGGARPKRRYGKTYYSQTSN